MARKYMQKKTGDNVSQAGQAPSQETSKTPGLPMETTRSMLMQRAMNDRSHRIDLPDAMREKMEQAFDMSFGKVNIYESEKVADAGANAIAQGGNIAFAPGKDDFNSLDGQRRLGHELSHIAAQARGEVTGRGFLDNGALEARADREGALAAAGEQAYSGPMMDAPSFSAAAPMQANKDKKKKTGTGEIQEEIPQDPGPEMPKPTLREAPDPFAGMDEQTAWLNEKTDYEQEHLPKWEAAHAEWEVKKKKWDEYQQKLLEKRRKEELERLKKEGREKELEELKRKWAKESAEKKAKLGPNYLQIENRQEEHQFDQTLKKMDLESAPAYTSAEKLAKKQYELRSGETPTVHDSGSLSQEDQDKVNNLHQGRAANQTAEQAAKQAAPGKQGGQKKMTEKEQKSLFNRLSQPKHPAEKKVEPDFRWRKK